MSRTPWGLVIGTWFMSFGLLVLSGPGRIDIVDGQTRFDVGRSLVEHGDVAIRDPRIWFARFPGRDGFDYTNYRLPQSLLAAGAIVIADVFGGPSEDRRHFVFTLTSATTGAMLAAMYLGWFVRSGLSPVTALAWSVLGIVATPSWFYSTSTFDDILGATALVAAATTAATGAQRAGHAQSLIASMLVALAIHCKPPLAVFALPVVALADQAKASLSTRIRRAAIVLAGGLVGLVTLYAYEAYKFPPEVRATHAIYHMQYVPLWPGTPLTAALVLALSPSAGFLWYCPATLLPAIGLARTARVVRYSVACAIAVFVIFICTMTIFKGDPAWGPRYLVPLYALLWLWAPLGAKQLGVASARLILALSIVVQLMSLAVDPHALYVRRALPSAFGAFNPLLYFDLRNAHLVQRPGEILSAWRERYRPAPKFTPADALTFAFPVLDRIPDRGPEAARRYVVLKAYRPWWVAFQYVPRIDRPVSIAVTVALAAAVMALGFFMIYRSLRVSGGVDP
jgi:hypothetical protein